MGTPFNVSGVANIPGTPGLPNDPLPFGISANYDSRAQFQFNLPDSSGTQNVDFGTMPPEGAKLVLVVYEPLANAPAVMLAINDGESPATIELTTGGFLAFGSPTPSTGITQLSITYTGAGKLRVWLLG